MIGTPGLSTTRRATLAGSVAGVLAGAGCDLRPDAAPRSGGPSSAAPTEDPDAALVDEAVARSRHVLGLVLSLPDRDRRAVAGLATLHRAHLHVLQAPQRPGHHAGPAGKPALSDVRGAEAALQRRLARLAVSAESGQLARVLASMSAGIAAHLAATASAATKRYRAQAPGVKL